jgi:hypothetical protein
MADLSLDLIEFIAYHQPGLANGNYQISVTQTVGTIDEKIPTSTFSLGTQSFTIAGESLTFNPQVIESVFPPAGSLGEHSNVLPHIIFNRSTIPWERHPILGSTDEESKIPWLALLLFEEEEKPIPQIVTLTALNQTPADIAKFSTIPLEAGQKEEDRVTVIDVNKQLLQTLLPNLQDLALMSHVRRSINFIIDDATLTSLKIAGIPDRVLQKLTVLKGRSFDEKTSFEAILKTTIGDLSLPEYQDRIAQSAQTPIEIATVIGNRLPKRNSTNTVHLISLAARYPQGKFKDLIGLSRIYGVNSIKCSDSGILYSSLTWIFT